MLVKQQIKKRKQGKLTYCWQFFAMNFAAIAEGFKYKIKVFKGRAIYKEAPELWSNPQISSD